jgi:hypothetical protein
MLPSRARSASRLALTLAAAAAIGAAAHTAAASDVLARPGEVPEKHITLDEGRLWKAPWRVIAYRTKTGHVCEAVVRKGNHFDICSNVAQVADPILIPFAQTKAGPKPTTYMVIAVSEEIATVKIHLAPGGRVLTERVRELSVHQSNRSGLPSRFRFVVVAVPKVRGFTSIRGLGPDGRVVGRREGTGEPP